MTGQYIPGQVEGGREGFPPGVQAPVPPPPLWIGSIMSAAAHAGTEGAFAGAGGASSAAESFGLTTGEPVIVILVDGLGYNQLLGHLGHAPTLRGLTNRPVAAQTCAPSTTAAALTSLATGKLPGETRMVGYSVRHGSGVMNLLQFAEGVDGATWQPEETVFEAMASQGFESVVVTDQRFIGTGLTHAAMRGARFVGAKELGSRFRCAGAEVRKHVPLTYVYWSGIDKVGHKYGPNSREWAEALEDFDSELGAFLSTVAGTAQVILTADHGMVEVDLRVDIARIAELSRGVEVLAGEGRAAHVHAERGEERAVEERWRNFWEDRAWIFNREEIPAIVGSGPGCDLIGDLLVMPKGNAVVVDSRSQTASSIAMPGVHGSLTKVEMEIPVWRLV